MKTNTPTWQDDYDHWIEEGTATSTRRAYSRDVTYFWVWMKKQLNEKEHYPVSSEYLIQFCLYHINANSPSPLKLSTIRRYLSSLSLMHMDKGMENPTRSEKLKLLLRRAKAAKKEQPNKKAAITLDILKSMINTCDESLTGIRDKAILLVGFASGGRRRSEITEFNVEDLTLVDDGYLIELKKSKTDQEGEGKTVPVFGDAATALKVWLVKSGLRQGPLFRGIKSNDTFYNAISPRTINLIVKRHIKMIGLNADEFGAHSLRAGFISESSHQGINLTEAMMLSGHRSIKVAQGYCQANKHQHNKASHLL